jgi:FkbM family methyltransferase
MAQEQDMKEHKRARQAIIHPIRELIRAVGFDVRRYRPYHNPIRRFRLSLQRREVGVVLDLGANRGQFAQALRRAGYIGRIISFEPLSAAHADLLILARCDPLWDIAPRCALAAKNGVVEINIAQNSYSSSILDMLERHTAGAPESQYIGKETVTATQLDSFLDSRPDVVGAVVALKMDTQGYEAEVLSGLNKWNGCVDVILTEMPLAKLYKGETRFVDLYRTIEDRGYRCISIEPAFIDPITYEVLQVDAIFER